MTALSDFLGLSEADFARIAQYRSILEAEADTLARAFYDYLLSYPITSAVFRDFTPERLDSLIQKQADHAHRLLSSRLDGTWCDDMRAVGALHYRWGIQPAWVAGAYTLYWRHWQKVLYTRVPLDDREALQDALFRLLTGDLMIQLEGYAEASRETDTERSALFHILLDTLTNKEGNTQSTESLLNRICDALPRKSRGVVLAGYVLRNAGESLLQWTHQAGDWPSPGAEAPLGPGDPCWETLHRHEHLVQSVDDPSAPAWMQSLRGRAKEVGCFPFETEDLQGVGVVAVRSRGYFQQVGFIYFDAFASLGELVLHLRNESLRDPLTHLPNRRLFQDRLALALDQNRRREKLLGIGILDLDGFKQINDSLGHDAGDQFLKTIAQRIQSTLRRGDTLARLGGDEFGLILPNLDSLDDLESFASRILDAVRSPLALSGEAVYPAASLGLTVHPMDDDAPEALLQHADLALYAAKTGGRDRFRLHDLQLEDSQHAALEQRRLLEKALERQWLTVVYQPIVSSTDGMTAGVE
ncbi:MAG: diguanylate cyclase domain-containing protein, partial [Phycisphaerae bacterium]